MMRNPAFASRRARTSCSILAVATVMVVGASPAAAQSLLGSGTFTTNGGGVAGIATGPSTTTVTVNGGQSVIDWTPTDNAVGGGPIQFQLGGTTATFTGATNFAVLNRINQTDFNRVISMDGTINSLVGGSPGGSLYFYSPGGFLLGSNSLINVGSLVLSASPLTLNANNEFITGANNHVIFGQAPQATAGIVTSSGSQINALVGDAYVAMVAPRVQHGGTINVTGSAALVGAEGATINFSPSGLFDIQVTSGTTDSQGVVTSGTITGAASTNAATDAHRAYLVAVPKNTALTMLIGSGSNLGFNVAGAANVVGNTVVLSAGHDVAGGSIVDTPSAASSGGAVANLQVNDGSFTSAVVGDATGFAHLSAFNPMHFYSDVDIHANGAIWFSSQTALGTLDVDGNLTLSTERAGDYQEAVTTAGIDVYTVTGGRITVDGTTNLNTSAQGGTSYIQGTPGGAANAGAIAIQANTNGAITLTGQVIATADAYGGTGSYGEINGGNATGGNVSLRTIGTNGALTMSGGVQLNSNGYGGTANGGECGACANVGGTGQGGIISVSSGNNAGAAITIAGGLGAAANGVGGIGGGGTASAGGDGTGGQASLSSGTGSGVTVTGNVRLDANGIGGNTYNGQAGNGSGGWSTISESVGATGGTMTINGNVELGSDGRGGIAYSIDGVGGDGFGGFGTNAGSNLYSDASTITINGEANIHSIGYGGDSGYGVSGDAFGGEATIISHKALTITGLVDVSTDGIGGTGNVGGDASGGDILLIASNGGTLTLSNGGYPELSAVAYGGESNNGDGGAAYGGKIIVYARGASSLLNVTGALSVDATAYGGYGAGPGTGGDAYGGDISIFADQSGTASFAGNLNVNADAYGGDGTNGGYASGGGIALYSLSALTIGGSSYLSAGAYGGDVSFRYGQGQQANVLGGTGGDGDGGSVDVYAQNGSLTLVDGVTLRADGAGGGVSGGTDVAGNGTGGAARLFANVNGTVDLQSSLTMTAMGNGGALQGFGAIGGDGHGGDVRVQATAANAKITIDGAATLDATGEGSSPGGECNSCGGQGGDGTGGTVWVDAFNAPTASIDFGSDLSMIAKGLGGDGDFAAGGNGQGGQVLLQATAGANVRVAGSATLNTDATGGASRATGYDYEYGYYSDTATGGNAIGGQSRIQTYPTAGVGGIIAIDGSAYVYARGTGGYAGGDSGSIGGNGTGGTAHVLSTGGSITVGTTDSSAALIMANDGRGGDAYRAQGGNGTAGQFVSLEAINGDITINGYATLTADGYGGSGATGGDGIGSGDISDPDPVNWTGGTHIYARNGDVLITGGASLSANGQGGDGGFGSGYGGDYGGDGGDGVGGWATIFAANSALGASSINILSSGLEGSGYVSVTADASGGNGGLGGNGANGLGGSDGGYGTVGSDGTAGTSGIAGVNGGNGGNATAGAVSVTAAADNGHVAISYVTASATAEAGDGGDGGSGGYGGYGGNGGSGTIGIGGNGGAGGAGGAGGTGGAGGIARGGAVTVGTSSGSNQVIGLGQGTADFTTVTADTSAYGGDGGYGGRPGFGGNGGNGGTGTPGGNDGANGADGAQGLGGAGGDAFNGAIDLLVRGSTVTLDTASLTSNATGGDGGYGYDSGYGVVGDDGIGGNATLGLGGRVSVVVTSRYLLDSQRGALFAGDITGQSIASAGYGSINGTSATFGGNNFILRNADATIGSLDLLVQADSIGDGALADSVRITNGDANIDGAFNFVTSGNLSLFLDGGNLTADSIQWHASDFVPDAGGVAPVDNGTFYGRHFDIATDNNFLTTANIDSIEGLEIVAPGSIYIADVNVDSWTDFWAQNGEVVIGNLFSNGDVDIQAGTRINTLAINGNGTMNLTAGAEIVTATIDNSGDTSLDAGDYINIGALDSGSGAVSLVAGSSIFAQDVTGGSIYGNAGDAMFFGNLTASGGDVRLIAGDFILAGNVLSSETIDLDAGGYIDGGTMTAGDSVELKAGSFVSVDDLSAGIVNPSSAYDADYTVAILAGTTIDTGNITALNNIGLAASSVIATGNIDAGHAFLALGGSDMGFGSIHAGDVTYLANRSMMALGGEITNAFDPAPILAATPVPSGGNIAIGGPVTTGKFVAAAVGTIGGSTIDSDSSIYALSGGNQSFTTLDAGSSVFQRSNGTIVETNLGAGTFIDIRSQNGLTLGNLLAGDYIDLRSNGAIGLGNATSGQTISFQTNGTLTGLAITAGDSVLGRSVGAMQLGAITAGITNPSSASGAIYRVGLASDGNIVTGAINSRGNIGFGTPANVTTGNLTTINGGILALVGGNMSFGSMTTGSGGYVYLADDSMSVLGGAFETFNRAPILALDPVASGGSIAINGPINTGNFRAAAGTTFNSGAITSATNIYVWSGGNMAVGNLAAGLSADATSIDAIRLRSGGSIVVGDATARDGIDFEASGTVTGGNLTSGRSVSGTASGAIVLGNLSAGLVNPAGAPDQGFSVGLKSATSIAVGNVGAAQSVGFASPGSITAGTIGAGGDVLVLAGANINLGTINATGRVYLANSSMFTGAGGTFTNADGNFNPSLLYAIPPVATGGSISTGAITAGNVQAQAGTTLTTGAINSNVLVALGSGGALTTGNVTAGTELYLTSGASITGGNLTARNRTRLTAGGAVNVGNVIINVPAAAEAIDGVVFDTATGTPVEIFAASIATGNISTNGYVGLYTPGTMTVGTIDAGHDIVALAGGNAAFGAIHTNERFLLAGYSMFAGLGSGNAFNPALAFSATKTRTGGTATFGGSSVVNNFAAYTGGNTTLQSLTTTGGALVDTTALFTLNGTLNGASRIISNDIDIGSGGAVNNGSLQLISRNATQTVVGDGVTGGGYQLSDSEFDRIRTPLTVAADVSYGAAAKMLIGDLTGTVGAINAGGPEYIFATINGSSATSVGTIRVVGDATFSGLGLTDEISFRTNTFEVDAATGSVNLFGSGTTLSGVLGMYAPRVWVASGDILTRLEANPRYAGYIAELNAPATVQRPEGVLRAASFEIDALSEPVTSLLVQNTGTTAIPAGFLLTDINIDSSEAPDAAPGSVDLVINGQIISGGTTGTGVAVRDGLVTEFGTEPFTTTSTINGCPLTGSCGGSTPIDIHTVDQTDIQLVDNGGLGDGLFGNEPDIDDGENGDEGDLSSPIEPPIPLFDSRPLDPSGEIDDPVSGAGNPSLYGNPDSDDGGDSDDQKKAKKAKKGDGK